MSRKQDHRPLLGALGAVLAVWLYLFPYSAALNNPNERTRVLQARALVERGELSIGEIVQKGRRLVYRDPYGRVTDRPFVNDIAVTCLNPAEEAPRCVGRLYPAKPPGAALAGAPFLWAAEKLGAVPAGPGGETRATWVLRLAIMAVGLLGLAALGALAMRAGV